LEGYISFLYLLALPSVAVSSKFTLFRLGVGVDKVTYNFLFLFKIGGSSSTWLLGGVSGHFDSVSADLYLFINLSTFSKYRLSVSQYNPGSSYSSSWSASLFISIFLSAFAAAVPVFQYSFLNFLYSLLSCQGTDFHSVPGT
jgi:hypothetical protein